MVSIIPVGNVNDYNNQRKHKRKRRKGKERSLELKFLHIKRPDDFTLQWFRYKTKWTTCILRQVSILQLSRQTEQHSMRTKEKIRHPLINIFHFTSYTETHNHSLMWYFSPSTALIFFPLRYVKKCRYLISVFRHFYF